MAGESTQLRALDPDAPACVHHWLLGEPVGNQVAGHCKRCGARRLYSSSIEGTDRFDDYREITATSEYYAQPMSA
ncbi:MAG: hypothetical protein WCQ48_01790 [Chloroflexota bacterium]